MSYIEYLDEGYYKLQKALNLIECRFTNTCDVCKNQKQCDRLTRILSDLSYLKVLGGINNE